MRDTRTHLQTRRATRVLLALNAALVLLLVMQWSPPATVSAGPTRPARSSGGLVNPADQRYEILMELRRLGAKLDKLNETLSTTMEVRVVEMPAGSGD